LQALVKEPTVQPNRLGLALQKKQCLGHQQPGLVLELALEQLHIHKLLPHYQSPSYTCMPGPSLFLQGLGRRTYLHQAVADQMVN
jgi:hypothetical protein